MCKKAIAFAIAFLCEEFPNIRPAKLHSLAERMFACMPSEWNSLRKNCADEKVSKANTYELLFGEDVGRI